MGLGLLLIILGLIFWLVLAIPVLGIILLVAGLFIIVLSHDRWYGGGRYWY